MQLLAGARGLADSCWRLDMSQHQDTQAQTGLFEQPPTLGAGEAQCFPAPLELPARPCPCCLKQPAHKLEHATAPDSVT